MLDTVAVQLHPQFLGRYDDTLDQQLHNAVLLQREQVLPHDVDA